MSLFCFVWWINHIAHLLFCFRFISEQFHDIIWNDESICSIFWFVMTWFNHMWIFMDKSVENVIRIQQLKFILTDDKCSSYHRQRMIRCMTCATDHDDICGDGVHICCLDNLIKTCEALVTSFEFLYDLIFHSMIREMKLAWEIKTINY